MKKLITGIINFRKEVRPQYKDTFAQLALGQSPDALLIGCSDSRVAVNLFASTEPGDLFVIRNVGNIIPPSTESIQNAEAAALEFALQTLKIKDIIVCGHSECGAMQAIDQNKMGRLEGWLKHSLPIVDQDFDLAEMDEKSHNKLSQKNVLLQLEHLRSYPLVKHKEEEGKLNLHAWWFELSEANVYCYEKSEKKFVIIDENEAKRILQRLKD